MVPLVFVIGKLVRFINGDPVDSFLAAVRETLSVALPCSSETDRLARHARESSTKPRLNTVTRELNAFW